MTKQQKYILSQLEKNGRYIEICHEDDLPEAPPNCYWIKKRNVFQDFFNQWIPQWFLQRI